ncbi:MAG TPA: hypothetical protein VFL47_04415, partial [Flavisolibacter sp.]|nr:hypothetical protein [Flavisolibacter sp.]
KNLPLLILGSGLLLSVAFAQTTRSHQKPVRTDTVPTQKKIRDLDEALAEIDRGEIEMQKAMKEIDQEKLESEVRLAMKNMDKDMAKMKEDLAKAMKEIDMQKINLDVEKAMKDIDCEKLKQEVTASLSKVDMEKMKADLEKTKAIDLSKMKEELSQIQPQVEKAMKEAKVSIEKARQEITAYKNLVNALDKDGLLNKNEPYTIEYNNNELTVNGKKLSVEQTKKYSQFLSGKDKFTLQKDEDGLNITNK